MFSGKGHVGEWDVTEPEVKTLGFKFSPGFAISGDQGASLTAPDLSPIIYKFRGRRPET